MATRRAPAEASSANVDQLVLATAAYLRHFIESNQPLRMIDDAYLPIVLMARRFHDGTERRAVVQRELDRVFGDNVLHVRDITDRDDD